MWFDDMVARHIGWIARQAFTFCKRKEDVDDLAQETLLKILCNRDKYDRGRDFKPWALTIMVNTYKTQHARRGRVPFLDVEDEDYDALAPDSSDDTIRFRDALKALRRAARMSVGVECVILYAKGYTYDEIADIVGVNIGTVRSRIAAGRKLIRRLMEE